MGRAGRQHALVGALLLDLVPCLHPHNLLCVSRDVEVSTQAFTAGDVVHCSGQHMVLGDELWQVWRSRLEVCLMCAQGVQAVVHTEHVGEHGTGPEDVLCHARRHHERARENPPALLELTKATLDILREGGRRRI